MTRKVTMIIGEPAVGKSAIMRLFLDTFKIKGFARKPFCHHFSERAHVTVLGRYDEDPNEVQFPGTDRLSMSVQPVAQQWILADPLRHSVLFEGDRLGNLKMAQWALDAGLDLVVLQIVTHPDVLAHRRATERHQREAFVRGRATKIANIVSALPAGVVVTRANNEPDDMSAIADWIWAERIERDAE